MKEPYYGYEIWHTDLTHKNEILGQMSWRHLLMQHLSWWQLSASFFRLNIFLTQIIWIHNFFNKNIFGQNLVWKYHFLDKKVFSQKFWQPKIFRHKMSFDHKIFLNQHFFYPNFFLNQAKLDISYQNQIKSINALSFSHLSIKPNFVKDK